MTGELQTLRTARAQSLCQRAPPLLPWTGVGSAKTLPTWTPLQTTAHLSVNPVPKSANGVPEGKTGAGWGAKANPVASCWLVESQVVVRLALLVPIFFVVRRARFRAHFFRDPSSSAISAHADRSRDRAYNGCTSWVLELRRRVHGAWARKYCRILRNSAGYPCTATREAKT